jgi:hypothetical protein
VTGARSPGDGGDARPDEDERRTNHQLAAAETTTRSVARPSDENVLSARRCHDWWTARLRRPLSDDEVGELVGRWLQ